MQAADRSRAELIWSELKYREYGHGLEGFIRWCGEIFTVRNKTSEAGRSYFNLFDFQEDLAEGYFTHRKHVVLKSRQLGATTLGMALALWRCLYQPGGANVLVLSKTQVDARANLEMIRFALTFVPDWYKARMPETDGVSADRIVFRLADGSTSTMEALVATERSGASRTASLVIADEAALWRYPEDTMRSIAPATDAAMANLSNEGAVLIVFSTARGGSNYFASLWRDANAGRNDFVAHFVPWYKNPLSNPKAHLGEVDKTLVEARRKEFASEPHLFYSEYPSTPEEAFLSSGASRFPDLPSIVNFEAFPFRGTLLNQGMVQVVDDDKGAFYLAYDPAEEPDYLGTAPVFIGADPAMGVGKDNSVAYAVRFDEDDKAEILGYWSSNRVEPTTFADALYDMGHYFSGLHRPAQIAVEVNPSSGGGGLTVVERLRERGYTNLYRYVQPAFKGRKALSLYGLPMTRAVKPSIVNNLASYLQPDELTGEMMVRNVPPILRDELGTFVVKPNGSVSADTGSHDDHVIAFGIALYTLHTSRRTPTLRRLLVGEEKEETPKQTLTLDLSGIKKDLDQRYKRQRQQEARNRARYQRRATRSRR